MVITLVEAILLLLFSMYLVRFYADPKRTPLYVKILTMIGWFLGFAVILFLP